jgi:hypothetical protein
MAVGGISDTALNFLAARVREQSVARSIDPSSASAAPAQTGRLGRITPDIAAGAHQALVTLRERRALIGALTALTRHVHERFKWGPPPGCHFSPNLYRAAATHSQVKRNVPYLRPVL